MYPKYSKTPMEDLEQYIALSCVIFRSLFFNFSWTFPSSWLIFLAADKVGYEFLMFNVNVTDWGRPLPGFSDLRDRQVWSILRSNILTDVHDHCLFGNSRKILWTPYPFSSLISFIAALLSLVNGTIFVFTSAHWLLVHCWRHCVFV